MSGLRGWRVAGNDINSLDPNATLLRVRQLVVSEDAGFLSQLTEEEIVDMLLCSAGFIAAIKREYPEFVTVMLSAEANFD